MHTHTCVMSSLSLSSAPPPPPPTPGVCRWSAMWTTTCLATRQWWRSCRWRSQSSRHRWHSSCTKQRLLGGWGLSAGQLIGHHFLATPLQLLQDRLSHIKVVNITPLLLLLLPLLPSCSSPSPPVCIEWCVMCSVRGGC